MDKRWKILLITSVGLFMASLDLFIVNLAFPAISADFGNASISSLSWVLNAYAIIYAALLVPSGRIADRVGRKRVFLTGLVTFASRRRPVRPRPRCRYSSAPGSCRRPAAR